MEEIKIILNENIKYIIIAGIAFSLDFITGFVRALLEKNVQSKKLKNSIIKLLVYSAAIIMGGCLEILFPTERAFKLQIICLAIISTDFYSVGENNIDIFKNPLFTAFFEKIKNLTDTNKN